MNFANVLVLVGSLLGIAIIGVLAVVPTVIDLLNERPLRRSRRLTRSDHTTAA